MNKKGVLTALSLILGASTVCAQQDWDAIEITVHPVAGNVSYIEGSGGNIGLFIGEDGVFLIDDQYAPLTDRIVAAIREVTQEPIRFLVNTHIASRPCRRQRKFRPHGHADFRA